MQGHNFGSFDQVFSNYVVYDNFRLSHLHQLSAELNSLLQAVKWFASQNYAGGGQVSRASGTGLQNVNRLVGSVPVPTIDFQASMVDCDQQMCFGNYITLEPRLDYIAWYFVLIDL